MRRWLQSRRALARCWGMKALLASLIVVAAAGSAHAMGTDETYDVVAWNGDGSAALLHANTNRDGDTTDGYVVVDAKGPISVGVSQTTWQDSAHPHAQGVDTATCKTNLATLKKALDDRGFAGVTVKAASCTADRRDDAVAVTDKVKTATQATHLAIGKGNGKLWTVIGKEIGGLPQAGASDGDTPVLDVAAYSDKLAIALYTPYRGNPVKMQVLVFVPDGKGFKKLDVTI
jgi:hypothetical protein